MNKPLTFELTTSDPETTLSCLGDVIVIDEDLYDGTYSGHSFTAWINRIPFNASGGDGDCEEFWSSNKVIFGGADTPDLAICDLLKKLDVLFDNPPEGVDAQYVPCRPRFVFYTGCFEGSPVHKKTRAVCIDAGQMFVTLYPRTAELIAELTKSGYSRLFM